MALRQPAERLGSAVIPRLAVLESELVVGYELLELQGNKISLQRDHSLHCEHLSPLSISTHAY